MGKILCLIIPMSGLFVSSASFVEGNQDCSSCYQLDIGAAIGIITCDIFLTLFIAISVYCFVSHQKRRGSLRTQTRCYDSSKTATHQSTMTPKKIEVESLTRNFMEYSQTYTVIFNSTENEVTSR